MPTPHHPASTRQGHQAPYSDRRTQTRSGPRRFLDGFATVTNSNSTTAIKIAGTNVVIPLDTGHMSSPHPEFYQGQPLRCHLRRAFIQTSSFDRDVAYDPQPVSPTDPYAPPPNASGATPRMVRGAVVPATLAQIFARATKLGRPLKRGRRIVATTAPTHPIWIGPRHMAIRVEESKFDTSAESNCMNWQQYTLTQANYEAAGSQFLTADALTLVGAYGSNPATIFGVLKDVPSSFTRRRQSRSSSISSL